MTKICTNIEQSKKFIELGINVNTADMWYQHIGYSITDGKEKPTYFPMVIRDNISDDDIPAWSLSALMNLLPNEFTEVGKYSTITYKIDIRKYKFTDDVDLYQIAYGNYKFYEDGNSSWKDMINTGEKEDLLDAAYEMVVWLKENNKLINMSYKYFPNEFSSYEDYIKYLKEKGLAIEVPEEMYGKED